jgi:hypothetical protein
MTHHAFSALHEDPVSRIMGKAFIDGIRQELHLGGKRTLTKAVRQTLDLEVLMLAVGSSIKLEKTSDTALWRSQPPPK